MMRRLWWLLVLMLLPVADALADYTATPTGFQCNNSGWTKATLHDACQYLSSSISTPVPYAGGVQRSVEFGGPYPAAMGCHTFNSANAPFGDQTCVAKSWTCPFGGTLINVSGVMTCTGANPPPTCPVGQAAEDWFPANGLGAGFPVCADSGCMMTIGEAGSCVTYGSTGVKYCDFKGTLTGGTCNPQLDNKNTTTYGAGQATQPSGSNTRSDLPPTPSGGKTVPCPKGSVQGGFGIDGIPICIGTGTAPQNPQTPPPVTTKPPVTVNNSDGSTTTTQQTVQTNSDGSTTTTTTTTIVGADGTKTVNMGSATSNNTSGTAGKQDTPNTDQMNLCKQNPTLSICQNSSVSGDCTSGLSCSGDAVQCATLMAAQKLQCARQADEDGLKASPSKTLGDSILGGTDPSKTTIDTLIKGDTADMSAPTLDQGGFVGGGACIPDKSFSVMGRTVTVSFATVCSNIQPLRYIVMACAFILVYLMVARSVING